MTVVVRSLVGYSQSLDSVALPAFAMQKRTASTAALVAAVAAKTIQMDVVDAAVSDGDTVQYDAPLTGATLSPGDSVETQIVDPVGTIAALTVNLPANPYDGQHFTLATTQTVKC